MITPWYTRKYLSCGLYMSILLSNVSFYKGNNTLCAQQTL